jgi:tetratricopeptide (TPR) repeat protein
VQESHVNAAIAAGNLSELYLTMGDLRKALEFAQQSVDLADESGDAGQRMIKRTILAHALQQAGNATEAEALFREAEAMQKEGQPAFPLLYSLRGFQFCDLLLDQEKHRDVRDRANQTLAWAEIADLDILSIALDHLSLGRAHVAEAQQEGKGDFTQAAVHLDQAVEGLRQAGTQHHIPRGLLARAALHRVRGDFEPARRDLDEVMGIAERDGMGLFQADAYLENARLYLAMGDAPAAQPHLATAKEMIGRMGYHRRDGEVAELEERLAAG